MSRSWRISSRVAGEDLRLRYAKQQFGPYADQLRHVLIDMEGTLLTGVTADAPRAEIRLLPGATAWNERKKARYRERHIEKAWQRLESEGWIGGAGSAAAP